MKIWPVHGRSSITPIRFPWTRPRGSFCEATFCGVAGCLPSARWTHIFATPIRISWLQPLFQRAASLPSPCRTFFTKFGSLSERSSSHTTALRAGREFLDTHDRRSSRYVMSTPKHACIQAARKSARPAAQDARDSRRSHRPLLRRIFAFWPVCSAGSTRGREHDYTVANVYLLISLKDGGFRPNAMHHPDCHRNFSAREK